MTKGPLFPSRILTILVYLIIYSHTDPPNYTIKGLAASTAVERCQASGLGRVVAITMPRDKKEHHKVQL